MNAWDFLGVLRPQHWPKNILIVLGFFLAASSLRFSIATVSYASLIVMIFSFWIICSGNYILNDIVDRRYDQNHPLKKERVIAKGKIPTWLLMIIASCFWAIGVGVAHLFLGQLFSFLAAIFIIFAIAYNVEPVRLKDIPIIDVLVESLNSPIRLVAGYLILIPAMPPIWIILFLYFYTCALMNSKRLAEFQCIKKGVDLVRYRKVFRLYNKSRMSFLFLVYFILTIISLVAISIEYYLLFLMPTLMIAYQLYIYYLLSMQGRPEVQKPEYIYKNKPFLYYSILIVAVSVLFVFIRVIA
jgi:decaprenyl-phosphate phosphoribosyltransferase